MHPKHVLCFPKKCIYNNWEVDAWSTQDMVVQAGSGAPASGPYVRRGSCLPGQSLPYISLAPRELLPASHFLKGPHGDKWREDTMHTQQGWWTGQKDTLVDRNLTYLLTHIASEHQKCLLDVAMHCNPFDLFDQEQCLHIVRSQLLPHAHTKYATDGPCYPWVSCSELSTSVHWRMDVLRIEALQYGHGVTDFIYSFGKQRWTEQGNGQEKVGAG